MMNLQIVDGIFKDRREGTTLQGFCPLAQSLEWRLGQRYLRERASKAFTTDASPVPFVINNDSGLSLLAAELLFRSIRAAEQSDTVDPKHDRRLSDRTYRQGPLPGQL